MSALELFKELTNKKVRLFIAEGQLVAEGNVTKPMALKIRDSKADLIDLLEARKYELEERAAIMEFDGGLSREDAERAAIQWQLKQTKG